jgi:hypothetical protein
MQPIAFNRSSESCREEIGGVSERTGAAIGPYPYPSEHPSDAPVGFNLIFLQREVTNRAWCRPSRYRPRP